MKEDEIYQVYTLLISNVQIECKRGSSSLEFHNFERRIRIKMRAFPSPGVRLADWSYDLVVQVLT